MVALSAEQAEPLLGPIIGKLCRCLEEGFAEGHRVFKTLSLNGLGPTHDPGTVAAVIWDVTVCVARREFKSCEGVIIRDFPRQKLFYLVVQDHLVLRFKKLDRSLKSANYPTDRIDAYRNQALRETLFPSFHTHAEVGYVADATGSELTGIYVTCPDGRHLAWYIKIGGGSTIERYAAPELPASPGVGAQPPARRVRLRGGDAGRSTGS